MSTLTVTSAEDLLNLTDEQISGMSAPPEIKEETPEEKAARVAAEAEAAAQQETVEGGEGNDSVPGSQEDDDTPPTQVDDKSKKVEDGGEEEQPPQQPLGKGGEAPPVQTKPEGDAPPPGGEPDKAFNYEAAYKELMAPLKANGKTIELRSPDELKQLAQMGANYTKKMQALQPHRKLLMMLENNGLLDEGKLSYLIDLEKKNPEAIKKLVKEAGINPLDIDTEAESTYQQGNHRVSDAEAVFTTQLEDLKSTPDGVQTIQTINAWDQASKDVLWTNPALMATIHTQRENGIYGTISAEIERRRTLGIIPAEVPFLHAYKAVGDELNASGAFAKLGKPQKQPVATRTAAPKPTATNSDKANAAAPSRSTPKAAKPFVNPLAMSDEQFMKEFKDRL